jgi:hypothetical protein
MFLREIQFFYKTGGEKFLPALVDSSIWGNESTPVALDLKNPVEEWAWAVSWLLNVRVEMWVDCCRLWSVVCGRVQKFGKVPPAHP